jgi:hypothetical protein
MKTQLRLNFIVFSNISHDYHYIYPAENAFCAMNAIFSLNVGVISMNGIPTSGEPSCMNFLYQFKSSQNVAPIASEIKHPLQISDRFLSETRRIRPTLLQMIDSHRGLPTVLHPFRILNYDRLGIESAMMGTI